MKNSQYWQQRSLELENAAYKDSEQYKKELEQLHRETLEQINKDIAYWYLRFAKKNKITYAEAQQILNRNELEEFHWTVQKYIKYGQSEVLSDAWRKELENASIKIHVTRLESLQLQMRHHLEKEYAQRITDINYLLKSGLEEDIYQNAYEIEKGLNIGVDLHKYNESEIDDMLKKPWCSDGKVFSERLWGRKQQLVSDLVEKDLPQALIRGESSDKIIDRWAEKLDADRKAVARVVQTERAYVNSRAALESYKKLGVKKYQIIATLDTKTSNICRSMDLKVFDIEDFKIGVTANPFHCHCRTTTAPYFEDFTEDEKRAMRNPETNAYNKVPADMSYNEWKKKYVKDEKSDIIKERTTKDSKFTANREYINSEKYEPKFDNIGSKKQNKAVFKETKKLIKDNDMKNTEGVSIIDGKGNVIFTQKAGSYGGSVDLSCLEGLPNNSVVLTHNHPLSTSFSDDDIALLLDNPQIKTIIAGGHNGTVYKLSVSKGTRTGISDLTGRNSIIQEYRRILDNVENPNKVVEALANKYNWSYEVI